MRSDSIEHLEILRWAHGGEGVGVPADGRYAGRIVFVPEVVPGDVVTVAVIEAKARWARGKVTRIESPSPERVPVPCAVQGRCGGCPWMPGSAAAQAESRRKILIGELGKRLQLAAEVPVTMLESPARYSYRQRLKLTFEVGATIKLGFLGKHSHTLVDITRCEVADERINAFLPEVRAALAGRDSGKVTLLAGEAGVAAYIQDRSGATRLGPDSIELVFGDYRQRLAPDAFAQANAAVTGQMLATLERWARAVERGSGHAVELFAGAGTLTMALWRAGWKVTAYEVAPSAKAGFERTREAAGVPPEDGVWYAADLALGMPLPPPPPPKLVVLDPPRTGAAEIMPWVRAAGASHVIYVSCDLATGLRDLQLLTQDGRYRVVEVVGLDMFAHSGHQEIMVLAEAT